MKHPREEEVVSLALSLTTTDSSSTSTEEGSAAAGGLGASSSSSAAAAAAKRVRRRRRGPVVATSGEGDFVCKTCNRAFPSFQALGGHRTSHLRGRGHGLEIGVVGAKALKQMHKLAPDYDRNGAAATKKHRPEEEKKQQQHPHECHICGLGFEMGQALGGHMRRHREEMLASGAADDWVWRTQPEVPVRAEPPVLLQLFA